MESVEGEPRSELGMGTLNGNLRWEPWMGILNENLRWEPGEKPLNPTREIGEENRETNENILAL